MVSPAELPTEWDGEPNALGVIDSASGHSHPPKPLVLWPDKG
jgi:hypothetical protein